MGALLPYIYTTMWFIIGIALLYVGIKNKFGVTTVVLSVMFIFMGVWWLIDALIPKIDMLQGVYGWIFRLVIAVFVLASALCYLQYRKKHK